MGRQTKRLTRQLAEAQNWHCAYCQIDMTSRWIVNDRDRKDRNLKRLATTDEVIPRSHGGPRTYHNQVAACFMCNQGRGSINAIVYFTKVQEVGRRKAAAWGRVEQSRRDSARNNNVSLSCNTLTIY